MGVAILSNKDALPALPQSAAAALEAKAMFGGWQAQTTGQLARNVGTEFVTALSAVGPRLTCDRLRAGHFSSKF